jgi:hypothetical protein
VTPPSLDRSPQSKTVSNQERPATRNDDARFLPPTPPTATHRLLRLPSLTPQQADLLWTFIQELATTLWEAYEPELVDVARQELDLDLHHANDSTDLSAGSAEMPPL